MENKSPLRTTLYLDDIRTPKETLPNAHPWVVVRNYDSFVEFITSNGIPDLISFDHDLAREHAEDYYAQVFQNGYQNPDYDSYKEKTGLDCAKFLCEYAERMKQEIKTCVVHSHNPVGAQNIMSYINGFMKHMGWSGSCYQHRFPYTSPNKE
jgi:hypothetical protein